MKRLAAAVLVALVLAAPASAVARGATKSVNSITVDQAVLHYGDTVTFTATVASTVKYEFVRVYCWQQVSTSGSPIIIWSANSTDILSILYPDAPTPLKNHIGLAVAHDPGFVLGGQYEVSSGGAWFGGAASCVSEILSYRYGGVVVTGPVFQVAA